MDVAIIEIVCLTLKQHVYFVIMIAVVLDFAFAVLSAWNTPPDPLPDSTWLALLPP